MNAPAPADARLTIAPSAMTFAGYQAIEAVNWSTLKAILDSPLHYRHGLANPRQETPALTLGSAAHCAILEPDEFPRRYVVLDKAEADRLAPARNTIAGKSLIHAYPEMATDLMDSDAYKAACFAMANPGKVVLGEADYTRTLAMRDAVRAHPLVAPLLAKGRAEQSIVWMDRKTGIRCKCRLDWISESGVAICELKTARTTNLMQFAAQAWKLKYFHQGVYQRRGMLAAAERDLPVVFIAVESTPPFDVLVVDRIHDDSLYAAENEVDHALGMLAVCRKNDRWPGRYSEAQEMRAPRYVFADDDDNEVEE